MTTFADLRIGQPFYDMYLNLPHTKAEPLRYVGKRHACKECGTPAAELLNAKASDGGYVHFCPNEEVLTERVKVEA